MYSVQGSSIAQLAADERRESWMQEVHKWYGWGEGGEGGGI